MKGIAIFFLFLRSASPAPAPATGKVLLYIFYFWGRHRRHRHQQPAPVPAKFLRCNNSALGGHRALPKVGNERYCYIFFIFGVIWGKGVKGGPLGGTKKKQKMKKKI